MLIESISQSHDISLELESEQHKSGLRHEEVPSQDSSSKEFIKTEQDVSLPSMKLVVVEDMSYDTSSFLRVPDLNTSGNNTTATGSIKFAASFCSQQPLKGKATILSALATQQKNF